MTVSEESIVPEGGSRPWKVVAAVMIGNCCVATAYAILSPTLVANLSARQTSTFIIAVVTSIWALPNIFGGPAYTRIIARFHPRGSIATGVGLAVVAILMFPVFPHVWAWILLQMISGAVVGHFFLISEAWLNHFGGGLARGRIMALYGALPAIGYVIGVGAFAVVGYDGYAPFVAAAGAMALGLLPILLVRGQEAHFVLGGEEAIAATARRIPRLLTLAAIAGALETIPWGIYQVYALRSGYAPAVASTVIPTFYLGQLVLGYPLGSIADRVGRRRMLVAIGVASIIAMGGLVLGGSTSMMWLIVAVTGGLFNAVYTLGLALLGEAFDSKALVAAGTVYMTLYSVGAVLGPPAVGAGIDLFGLWMFPGILAGLSAVVVLLAITGGPEWRR